jgi:ABC-type antimicrobial peptide transport system permease subunit
MKLRFPVVLCLLFALGVVLLPAGFFSARAQTADPAMIARLQKDVAALTQYPSRVPGTPGNIAAANYMAARFKQIGLEGVRAEEYDVTVPVTKNATLQVGSRTLRVLPMYPNHVAPSSTPPAGISGPLIYARKGMPRDFNGQQIKGAIVVLDFNSGINWITAADLGAKAVIFIEPDQALRGEAERKFSNIPLEIPRYYLPRAQAAPLIGSFVGTSPDGASVLGSGVLKSQVEWQRVKARNIIGMVRGTDAKLAQSGKGNTVVIDAYYDSMAITPDLAPGGEAAANAAALLEVAQNFVRRRPKFSVMFVANGAHHVALAGTRNFAATHFLDDGKKGSKEKVARFRAFIGLDLTSRTDTVGVFAKSWFYNQMNTAESILINQFAGFAKKLNDRADGLAKRVRTDVDEFYVDGVTGRNGRSWRSYLPALVALDSEVATMAQKPGVSFATANDARLLQDTPFDTADKVNLPNVARQISTISNLLGDLNDVKAMPQSSTLSANFGYAAARAITRGDIKEKVSFVPDTPIADEKLPLQQYISDSRREMIQGTSAVAYVLDRATAYKSYAGVRGAFIERAVFSKGTTKLSTSEGEKTRRIIDQQPTAQFLFIGPRVGDSKGGGTPELEVEAYSINNAGRIIYAPDMGAERERFTPKFKTANAELKWKDKATGEYESNASVMCFESRAVPLFDTLDQRYFSVLKEMTVLDARTDSEPVEFGFLAPMAPPGGVAEIEPAAVVFGRHGSRFKLIMAQGLLGKRLVVLNTQPQLDPKTGQQTEKVFFEGAGVLVPEAGEPDSPVIHVAYQTALDLWTVDQQRIRLLKSFGINNQRVDNLHGMVGCKDGKKEGDFDCPTEQVARPNGGAIGMAQAALANFEYDQFYLQARRAFGMESRAYPDVEATSQDVLKGIIFYLALLIPFSFFTERLLFGFPDVRKQIFGTSLMFLLIFAGIRFVHPAFELALTPFIILLAFIILALTVVVTLFLSSKFEQEIKRLKQGVHFEDVGRLSTISAALGLGIANMRRRPMRTALTCVTLILLTFTVLSFTSVTANITNFARPYGDSENPPAYAGLMVRQPDWSALQEAAVTSMTSEFRQRFGNVARRAWYLSRDQGELLQLRVSSVDDPNRFFHAPALMGAAPEEKTIGSPIAKTLVAGKWFDDPTRLDVCLVPRWILLPKAQRQAESAAATGSAPVEVQPAAGADGSTPEAGSGPLLGFAVNEALGKKIQVGGKQFEIIGVFDNVRFRKARDLDGEGFTPVDYQNDQNKQAAQATQETSQKGEEVAVQSYQHMDANALVILPYDTVLTMGGNTRSLASGFANVAKPQAELEDLMNRAALGIFGATPNDKGKLESKLYSSVESTSYEGFAALVVPILIAAMIIANTMLGSVFERTKEIGIYSSVGLAPVHVAALFIAEAAVYAVLGSIAGYLIAQVLAKIITANNLLQGLTLNYSSGSAVISTVIVMATVLLSTLYPAWAAGRMSQPDVERKWRMSEPVGDMWRFQFPFTVSGQQPLGVAEFLWDFFQAHTDTSVGKFYTDKVELHALTLREAVNILNTLPDGTTLPAAAPAASTGSTPDASGGASKAKESKSAAPTPTGPVALQLENIAADPETEVYHLSMRNWLAPFDMGVSQDADIMLIPSPEEGLYELQLKLVRQSGELSAWKRTNRGFISDLRKQLLVWRMIKPADQHEYVLRGRAHVSGEHVPTAKPDAELAAV